MAPDAGAGALAAFAIVAPGLEPLAAAELAALGIRATVDEGGAGWVGSIESVARANLWLRTASRVVVRIGRFRARTFFELERHAGKLPWERFLPPGVSARFRVTARKSRLYHSEAIAERLARAASPSSAVSSRRVRATGAAGGTGTSESVHGDDDDGPGQLFIARILRDVCTVSVDSSGQLLHRRGYRQAVAKAPLRETIAAAMLLGSEWPGTAPLIDPFCGSGTIPIEAALIARRIAPGAGRSFAFEKWPGFDRAGWSRLVGEARDQELDAAPAPIRGSDRDAGAVEAARANAERAGVAGDVELDVRPLSDIDPPPGPGWVVTNAPYGVRIGEGAAVGDLYGALGRVLRARCPGWTVGLLSPAELLDRQTGVALRECFATTNGGIPVRFLTGRVAR